jgi:hypothetical protein
MTIPDILATLLPPPTGRKRIVAVTGGRAFADTDLVDRALTAADPGMIIEGGARGADRLCREWAQARGVQVLTMAALWDYYRVTGRKGAAGPIRNAGMVEVARRLDAVLMAFPGGAGTADCVRRAVGVGMVVIEVGKDH